MSTLKFNQWLNSDSTENFKCRAWVNFNGTGTPAIRAAGNVSSITDNGTGDYTANFTVALPDANFAVASIGNNDGAVDGVMRARALLAGSVRLLAVNNSGTPVDLATICAAVFR